MTDAPNDRPIARAVAQLRARAAEAVRFSPRETVALAVLACLVITGAAVAYVRAQPLGAESLAPVDPSATATTTPGGGEIWVHVVGAVRAPGVYRFAEGARVFEAVRAARGLAPDADVAAVNLARVLADGEQVAIPRRGESPPGTSGGGSGGTGAGAGGGGDGKVNINTATAAELDALPGIGPVLAQRIVDYREQHGPFRTVRDLLKVSGIGQRKFESIEPHVTV